MNFIGKIYKEFENTTLTSVYSNLTKSLKLKRKIWIPLNVQVFKLRNIFSVLELWIISSDITEQMEQRPSHFV